MKFSVPCLSAYPTEKKERVSEYVFLDISQSVWVDLFLLTPRGFVFISSHTVSHSFSFWGAAGIREGNLCHYRLWATSLPVNLSCYTSWHDSAHLASYMYFCFHKCKCGHYGQGVTMCAASVSKHFHTGKLFIAFNKSTNITADALFRCTAHSKMPRTMLW